MSFWIPGDKNNGKRALYSISVSWSLILFFVVVLVALLSPVLQWLRN